MSAARLIVALALAAGADARFVNFRGSGRVTTAAVRDILTQEMADKEHHLAAYEGALRQMYASLPKNRHGNLEHQTVRYGLHRFFVSKYGWFFRGLEPSRSPEAADKEWVPEFLEEVFESATGHRGIDLRGLAALAASLEDLAFKETRAHLTDAYLAQEIAMADTISKGDAHKILETFFISFLVANNWTTTDPQDLYWKKDLFKTKYQDYNGTMTWFSSIEDRHFATERIAFGSLTRAAYDISKTYQSYNDPDCRALKSTLKNIEGKKPGRVRLSVFYNMSLYSHWTFTEKVEYLRALGALDETDPKQVSVIIPNYATSRLNCLNATNLYSICCRNTCEDLMAHLEKDIKSSTASPKRIAGIVANLESDSVKAPRELPAELIGRLDEVAAVHGGQVPLYGRLFAQWMHHAYPLDCPYPHEEGTTNPQSPEEWVLQTGQETEASTEEMLQHVQADSCVMTLDGTVDCGEESAELPWSMAEELLASGERQMREPLEGAARPLFPLCALCCLVAAAVLAKPLVRSAIAANFKLGFIRKSEENRIRVLQVSVLLAAAAYCADLLDGFVFGITLIGSLFYAGAKLAFARVHAARAVLPMQAKIV